ncbi:tRNA (adenosine(37)-N6)-threonylcarbamoyltransferase complex dimerization subunit type 1 TsaB [Ectothiorhodospira lacustris]|uniref:tRNA (adenosine(37)-N6)-threonylcarbamoyltransferase complex dimerization subunit type 1 TsaB n=1 Tax=Ectothiorhodospira lacustris TaxID=2899127 RepID=UPI001EE9A6D1|nr:tRNA (adenosine(37)-N6)-threonylcarbamoyltransferase complex dimerization subunit type 1 TsaB [Ectothiorhodospira lacustris]MCG5500262.1 tRNA (adenosine(37)-N6)-threonylcarbamoyltransferase complex dimerization subunit type 1 TsaB [Ectothiorhodospira lacustris]
MKLLAIETATEACSAALLLDRDVWVRFEVEPRAHARLILPMMEGLLAEAGLSLGQLDALAFGRGPGAFTGVRIATGVIQGAAFAADLPVVPVSTLAALAQQGLDEGANQVLAALDARMGEVYWGAFRGDEDGLAIPAGEEQVCAPSDAPLPEWQGWLGVGHGWSAHGDVLTNRFRDCLSGAPLADCLPSAAEVARLAARDFTQGMAVPAEAVLPVYLRNRVAEKPGRRTL